MLKSRFSFVFFLAVVAFLVLGSSTPAQTYFDKGDNSIRVKYTADVDSLTTTYSDWFSIADYLSHSLITYPVNYSKIQSSAAGKPHITVTVEGSNDQTNVVIVDTVGTVGDSLETIYSGNTNFNNKKFWYYRLKYTGTGTGAFANKSDATLRTDLVFIKPQP